MKQCQACGMPLINSKDFAQGNEKASFCAYCTHPDGSVKTAEEIFEGGVQYFLSQLGGNRETAERITRKNMNNQPYWKDNKSNILKGPMATDEEFAQVMNKM